MHQALAFLLAALVVLGPSSVPAQQATASVHIHITARDTCLIGNVDVSCSDVGAKLRELGTPLDADVHLIGDTQVTYKVARIALDSLRRAGFKPKIGLMTGDERAQ